ncbi:MAG: porin [Gammaproteobacteria bacterium]
MKTKLLTITLAAALCAPQAALAARDGEGMEYTSASEGFYGSIRTVFHSREGANKSNGPRIGADFSRLGVRGSLDLGHGLTGLYRYEWLINGDNGANTGNTRLSYVGLRGDFGEFKAGSHWAQGYNWVTSATDIASTGSGNFLPTGRVKNSLEYTTPSLHGLQGSFRIRADGGDASSEDIDEWAGAVKFGGRGFSFGGAYEVMPDMPVAMTTRQDAEFWAARAGYAGSDWGINAWYGEKNTSKTIAPAMSGQTPDDTSIFSAAANMNVGKVAFVGVFETRNDEWRREDAYIVLNVDYQFTGRSKAYFAYIANDYETDTDLDDQVRIGLRMDF